MVEKSSSIVFTEFPVAIQSPEDSTRDWAYHGMLEDAGSKARISRFGIKQAFEQSLQGVHRSHLVHMVPNSKLFNLQLFYHICLKTYIGK